MWNEILILRRTELLRAGFRTTTTMETGRGRGWVRAACTAGAALSLGVSGESNAVTGSAGRGPTRRLGERPLPKD